MTLTELLDKHEASDQLRNRLNQFQSPQDAWNNCEPCDLVWFATRQGILTERELRLFAIQCAREVQFLMTHNQATAALDVAERFANDNATREELDGAYWSAEAVSIAACAHAYTAYPIAEFAAVDAANFAAHAVRSAAKDFMNADYGIRASQAEWLRRNTNPTFPE